MAMLGGRVTLARGSFGMPGRSTTANQRCPQQEPPIKKEVEFCDLVDLLDSDEEREQQRVAGCYSVTRICTDDGTRVELIEFTSDVEEYDSGMGEQAADDADADISDGDDVHDDDDMGSNASTLDLSNMSDDDNGNTRTMESPVSRKTVGLTKPAQPAVGGLLYDYERMYVDLAQSSSSDDDDDDDNDDMEVDSDADTPRALVARSVGPSTTEKAALIWKIIRDVEELEARKPWKFVYRCLQVPFASTGRTDAYGFGFEVWDAFWTKHGQAVWERYYWKPLPPGSLEHSQRKNRQDCATKAFRKMAAELYQRFGDQMIDQLKQAPHSGWWYRIKPPVNLVYMRCHATKVYALHMSRFRERWPCGVHRVRQKGNLMWWQKETEPESESEAQ